MIVKWPPCVVCGGRTGCFVPYGKTDRVVHSSCHTYNAWIETKPPAKKGKNAEPGSHAEGAAAIQQIEEPTCSPTEGTHDEV